MIRERAQINNGWLGGRLHIGPRIAVSRIIRHAREPEKRDRKVKRAARGLRKEFV